MSSKKDVSLSAQVFESVSHAIEALPAAVGLTAKPKKKPRRKASALTKVKRKVKGKLAARKAKKTGRRVSAVGKAKQRVGSLVGGAKSRRSPKAAKARKSSAKKAGAKKRVRRAVSKVIPLRGRAAKGKRASKKAA